MRRTLVLMLLAACKVGTVTITDASVDTDLASTDQDDSDTVTDTDVDGTDTDGQDTDTALLDTGSIGQDTDIVIGDTDTVDTDPSADADIDGWTVGEGDCNDGNDDIHPGANEVCDQADQDCDGLIDEGTVCYDDDGDGTNELGGDCDDTNDDIHPGGTEVRDGVDQDCDGLIDDHTTAWDDDGDCYCDVEPCRGSVSPNCPSLQGGDCDDTRVAVNPGAQEACNGRDDNCVGGTDEVGATGGTTYYPDLDGDGYGVPGATVVACSPPANKSATTNDCYDSNAKAYPGAADYQTVHRGDGSYDYDCDLGEDAQYAENYDCGVGCGWGNFAGWTGAIPDCGDPGTFGTGCGWTVGWPYCAADASASTLQPCR